MSTSKAPSIRVPLDKAKHILLAKAIEQHAQDRWQQSDSAMLSMRVAHDLGEGATPERFLTERAERLLEGAADKGLSTDIATQSSLPKLFGLLIVLAAFVIGALSDRFTGSDHFINLLSAPFWGIVLWNLLAYLVILLGALGLFGRAGHIGLSLRGFLLPLMQKCSANPFSRGYKASFIESWTRLTVPLMRIRIARMLHVAAICFALGLIASLLVRGLSTAYWAGWESTWLAEKPEIVKSFLDWTYGLVPAVGGLPAMPDVATVASMRSDLLPYAQGGVNNAAPWLVRMIILLTAAVIMPRLILVLINTWRLKAGTNNFRLEISDPYFQDLLSESSQNAALGALLIIAPESATEQTITYLGRLSQAWGAPAEQALARINLSDPECGMSEISVQEKTLAALVLEGASTPEEDVQGIIIDKVRDRIREQGAQLCALLNMTAFSARQRSYPERIAQRQNNWGKFASGHSLALIAFDANESDASAVIKALRAQATTLTACAEQNSKDS